MVKDLQNEEAFKCMHELETIYEESLCHKEHTPYLPLPSELRIKWLANLHAEVKGLRAGLMAS